MSMTEQFNVQPAPQRKVLGIATVNELVTR